MSDNQDEHCQRCGRMISMKYPACDGCRGVPDITPSFTICVACCRWHEETTGRFPETVAQIDELARDGETRPQVVARVVGEAHDNLKPQEKP